MASLGHNELTYLGLNKSGTILQVIFSNAIFENNSFLLKFKFGLNVLNEVNAG